MKKIIGRVVPQPKGKYDKTYNYNVLDTVHEGAAIYQSLKADDQGHPVTDTNWWKCFYDLGEAIKAATDVDMPQTEVPSSIAHLMAIGTDGKAYSISPKTLITYILDNLSKDYDIVAVTKTN